MKTIGVVTTSRADYGIYVPILRELLKQEDLNLWLLVTGMHLAHEYGNTVDQIEKDGFPITARVPVPLADSPAGVAGAMGEVTLGFTRFFSSRRPDILLVLGDRYEMHAAAVAAIPFGIPLAHIHGGELTYGAFDELFRHSLTKMSHMHFASTEEYARRIRQMGEEPWRVVVSGAPSLDNLAGLSLLSKEELEREYHLELSRPTLLVTFHPVTLELPHTQQHIDQLLEALAAFKDHGIIFTAPNADTASGIITQRIRQFAGQHPHVFLVENFGARGYWSVMSRAAAMVGNSSSGILEAASMKLPVVNIGTRQEGRLRARNVIDVGCAAADIRRAIGHAVSPDFRHSLEGLVNPYGDGRAAKRIVAALHAADLARLPRKKFIDYPVGGV